MKKGKLIVIAGTDASGKETQTRMLVDRLRREDVGIETMSFPRYETPTGKIVGGPYLGNPEICESWFPEGPVSLDSKIASLYYAADRLAALPEIHAILDSGKSLILDRYVSANMGHQGAKIRCSMDRELFYGFLDKLEYGLLELPRPDETIFLHMPVGVAVELRKGRKGQADGHESDLEYLGLAEEAYLQLEKVGSWRKISCAPDGKSGSLKTPEKIHEEVYSIVKGVIGF